MRSMVVAPFLLFLICACGGGASGGASAAPSPSASGAVVLATPSGAKPMSPEAPDGAREAARTLAASILAGGEAMKTLTELTDSFGPRLTGSDVHAAAATWAAERFRAYGLTAASEPFPMDHGWVRGVATGNVVAPSAHVLHVASSAWSPGTSGPLRGQVVVVDDTASDAIAKRKDLAGKIALYTGKRTPGAPPRYTAFELAKAGAVAVLQAQETPANALVAGKCRAPKEAACTSPVLAVGHEDGAMLRRMVDAGQPVTVELTSTAALTGPVSVPNVVAEIRGREKPDELVIVGAHLDSWDFATGAQDNGSGAAEVLEAARAIHAMGKVPRRTMRFVLWGGEEEGLLGSRAYVKAHAAELDKVVLYLNTDHGATAPVGWGTCGRDDIVTAMKPIARQLLVGLGAAEVDAKVNCSTDHCPFMLLGVPTVNLEVDDSRYDEIHHLATDTVDKVKEAWLTQGAAVMAVTAFTIADLPDRIAPRIGHDTIAKHIAGSDIVAPLIAAGQWTP